MTTKPSAAAAALASQPKSKNSGRRPTPRRTNMREKKPMANGELNGMAQFTEEDIIAIRNTYTGAYGELSKLAREYNTFPSNIYNIIHRKRWPHVA